MRHIHDLRGRYFKLEHACSDENRGAAETVWAPPRRNPGTVHGLEKSGRVLHDIVTIGPAEAQAIAEAPDEEAWIDKRDLNREAQLLHKLHVNLAQTVHVDLGDIGEVYEQVGRLLDSTRDIETDGCNTVD